MSLKAKNLAYEKPSEPAFLARMRAQVTGQGDYPVHGGDAIPRRAIATRNKVGEDDGPTVVDESGNTLDYQEVEALKDGVESGPKDNDPNDQRQGVDQNDEENDTHRNKTPNGPERALEAGSKALSGRKRKVARVVGAGHDDSGEDPALDQEAGELRKSGSRTTEKCVDTTGKTAKKKKAKVALSFDADD